MTTISEALTKLKNFQSRISRTDGFITLSVIHYEDTQPEYNYTEEVNARSQLVEEIRKLKTVIQITNCKTKVDYKGQAFSLSELILMNSDLRSDLAFYQGQLDLTLTENFYGTRTRDDIKKRYAEGYDKQKIRKLITSLEEMKEEVESLINSTNLKTNLVEA